MRGDIPGELQVICLEAFLQSLATFLNNLALAAQDSILLLCPLLPGSRAGQETLSHRLPEDAKCLPACKPLPTTPTQQVTHHPPSLLTGYSSLAAKGPQGTHLQVRESLVRSFAPLHVGRATPAVTEHWPCSCPKAGAIKAFLEGNATQGLYSHLSHPHDIHLLNSEGLPSCRVVLACLGGSAALPLPYSFHTFL